jgi:hypothetical protein
MNLNEQHNPNGGPRTSEALSHWITLRYAVTHE